MKLLLVVCLTALAVAPLAHADGPVLPALSAPTHSVIDAWASKVAMRPVQIACPERADWGRDFFAQGTWGYTFLFSDYATVAPLVCAGALHEDDPSWSPWQRALGALVVTHESYHMRASWLRRGSEAAVECAAIRHFKVAVQMLGGTREQADLLLPYALALHWRIAAKWPQYNKRSCKVPNWWHPH